MSQPARGGRVEYPVVRTGEVFMVPNVPDMNGKKPINRRIIVVHPAIMLLPDTGLVIFVGASSTSTEEDRVLIPDESSSPGCGTGFDTMTFAVPRWPLFVNRALLNDYRGRISAPLVATIYERMTDHVKHNRCKINNIED